MRLFCIPRPEVIIAASVTQLVPRVAPFEEARAAFYAADYDVCLSRLEGNTSLDAGLLATRTLLRLRRSGEADRLLQMLSHDVEHYGTMRVRAEHALLQAVALSQRDGGTADEVFHTARVLAIASCDQALVGEVEMLYGVAAFGVGDLERAEKQMDRAVEESTDAVVNCWVRQTRGAIAAVRGNLAAQLDYESHNLDIVCSLPQQDVWLESWVLYNLSVLARELDRQDVGLRVRERAALLRWTPATALQEFQTFRHLAYTAALAGDAITTFRYLRKSAEAAPSASWRMAVVLDGAFFYRELGERTAMTERVDAAVELSTRIDWESSSGEERFALLELVELLAASDPVAARSYLATYSGVRRDIAPHLIYKLDARPRALESHRRGLVAAALGDFATAAPLLAEAIAFWESRGILWRAATASVDLALLTSDRADVARAARYAQRWPHAWFAKRFLGGGANAQVARSPQ